MKKVESSKPYLSIVIPAYNEEKRLLGSLEIIRQFIKTAPYPLEIIIIDDGSTDSTNTRINNFIKTNKPLPLLCIRIPHNGKAAAIIRGVKEARGRLILFSDIDFSVPLTALPIFIDYREKYDYDIVIASREGENSRRIGEPILRHVMGRVFNSLIRVLLALPFNDTQCGFKLFKAEAAKDLFAHLQVYKPNRKGVEKHAYTGAFDAELIVCALQRGYSVRELPSEWYYSPTKNVNAVRDSYKMSRDVVRIWWNVRRGTYS